MSFFISSSKGYIFTFLFALCVLLLLAIVSTELLIRRQVEPNDNLFYHLELFRSSQSTDIAMGDSHTSNGFAASGSFVNLAFPNENISVISRKVEIYIRGKPPGRILLQADPHMFAAYQSQKDVGYRSFLEKTSGVSSTVFNELRIHNGYHRPKLMAYWVSFLQHGELLGKDKMHSNGWLPSSGKWAKESSEKRATQARWRADMQRPVDDFEQRQPARAYRQMVRLLTSMRWKVCMVGYPASRELLGFTHGGNYERARAWFGNVAKEEGATYLDYRSVYLNKTDYFSNQDHLSPLGAVAFTSTVINDCFGLPAQ